jgi:hypothetical protein
MLKEIITKIFHKTRKYPIQKDGYGRSLRKRAFASFEQGNKPPYVAQALGMKLATANRYYCDWNKCPANFENFYKILKRGLKTRKEISPKIIDELCTNLGKPRWEVVTMLSKPHGLKQLLKGHLLSASNTLLTPQEQRLGNALNFLNLLETGGMNLDEQKQVIAELIKKAGQGGKNKTGQTG